MKNLGNYLIALMMSATTVMGSITASVDATQVQMGESVTFTVKASGQDVEKPAITELCGASISATSQGTSMRSVNGRFTKEYVFSYTFTPVKDCTIDPVALKIDGQEEQSEPVTIRVVPMQITKESPFILEMAPEKQQVYVGEPFKLVVIFKQRRDSKPVDSKFAPPQVKNFWIKEEQQSRRFEEGEYTVTRLSYVIAPQKAGTLAIDPAKIEIATRTASRDVWGQWLPQLKWRSYFSNGVEVEVLPLPEGVTLVGDFSIEATADKEEMEANEAVNVTLKVSGSGNFEDIGSLKPKIEGVALFDEEPKIDGYIENGAYKGHWSQKLAYVADRSFTVPSVALRYFDPQSGTVKTIQSAPLTIRVKNAPSSKAEPLVIERPAAPEQGAAGGTLFAGGWPIPFGAGVFAGALLTLLAMLLPWRRWLERDGTARVDPRDYRAVLVQLLPHRGDPEVDAMVTRLEAHLYGGNAEAVDARALKALLKRLMP